MAIDTIRRECVEAQNEIQERLAGYEPASEGGVLEGLAYRDALAGTLTDIAHVTGHLESLGPEFRDVAKTLKEHTKSLVSSMNLIAWHSQNHEELPEYMKKKFDGILADLNAAIAKLEARGNR